MVSHHILLLMYPIGCHLKQPVFLQVIRKVIIQNLNVLFLQEFFKKLKTRLVLVLVTEH